MFLSCSFSVVDIVVEVAGVQSSITSICRLLRILRPLKLLRMIDGMHIVLGAPLLCLSACHRSWRHLH